MFYAKKQTNVFSEFISFFITSLILISLAKREAAKIKIIKKSLEIVLNK